MVPVAIYRFITILIYCTRIKTLRRDMRELIRVVAELWGHPRQAEKEELRRETFSHGQLYILFRKKPS